MDALSSAYSGMMAASRQLDATAQSVAGGDVTPVSAVGMITAKTDFQANAAVMKTADQMLGSLLDIKV